MPTPKGIQRVLTENGITNAILGSRSGASKRLKKAASEDGALTPIFLAPGRLKPFIDTELIDGPFAPIDYIDGERIVRGYDAAILPAVCNVWLRAREAGALQKQQLPKAQRAELLTRALAQTGIVALIDEVTGYEKVRPQNALQAYLELVIRKELAAWAKKFPDEFYENIYRLRGWKWPGMQKNRFSVVAHYTRDLVYERLGPGVASLARQRSGDSAGSGCGPSAILSRRAGIPPELVRLPALRVDRHRVQPRPEFRALVVAKATALANLGTADRTIDRCNRASGARVSRHRQVPTHSRHSTTRLHVSTRRAQRDSH
jgi:hypothetical protein